MLTVDLIGSDLDYLAELLNQDKRSTTNITEEYTNAFVYEVLAYLG